MSITPFEIKKYPLPSLNALSTFTGSEQRKGRRHIRHYQLCELIFSKIYGWCNNGYQIVSDKPFSFKILRISIMYH